MIVRVRLVGPGDGPQGQRWRDRVPGVRRDPRPQGALTRMAFPLNSRGSIFEPGHMM
jgi:hypothetical protein